MSRLRASAPLAFRVVRRLCERPGCGAPAEVAYGIDKNNLVVWVDNRAILERELAGRLCRRHADALVPPRGWTLDDRREPVPKLFKVRDETPAERPRTPRAPKKHDDRPAAPVLEFPVAPAPNPEPIPPSHSTPSVAASPPEPMPESMSVPIPEPVAEPGVRELSYEPEEPTVDPDETRAVPWSPRLVRTENSDDPSGPVFGRLLGRAFGVRDRGHASGDDADDESSE